MSSVILVSIDGTRPDALAQGDCPNLQAFRDRSAYTMRASSVMPSITLPCHLSIFHSVPPARHGILSNDWAPMARPLPGLVEVAYHAGKRSAFFHNWEQLRDLSRPGYLEYALFIHSGETRGLADPGADDLTAQEAARTIAARQFDFAFVYFGSVDIAGHAYGWMSDGYLAQLAHVDAAFGNLLSALPADSTVLVQSDHGGHERMHGTDMAEDMLIPWMIGGPGIRQGHEIAAEVSLLDTAPTLARIMGLAAPAQWEGRCPDEIFA